MKSSNVKTVEEEIALDELDKEIISALLEDAKRPYINIAAELKVSGGTIHVRMERLMRLGIVKGSTLILDYKKLGYDVLAFIGINLHQARDYRKVIQKLTEIRQIVEAYYSTGQYNIFTKVLLEDIPSLHAFLLKVQEIKEVHSTQTILVLDAPFERSVNLLD